MHRLQGFVVGVAVTAIFGNQIKLAATAAAIVSLFVGIYVLKTLWKEHTEPANYGH